MDPRRKAEDELLMSLSNGFPEEQLNTLYNALDIGGVQCNNKKKEHGRDSTSVAQYALFAWRTREGFDKEKLKKALKDAGIGDLLPIIDAQYPKAGVDAVAAEEQQASNAPRQDLDLRRRARTEKPELNLFIQDKEGFNMRLSVQNKITAVIICIGLLLGISIVIGLIIWLKYIFG